MTRLLILVEGQSEEIFVKQTLTPYLASHGKIAPHRARSGSPRANQSRGRHPSESAFAKSDQFIQGDLGWPDAPGEDWHSDGPRELPAC